MNLIWIITNLAIVCFTTYYHEHIYRSISIDFKWIIWNSIESIQERKISKINFNEYVAHTSCTKYICFFNENLFDGLFWQNDWHFILLDSLNSFTNFQSITHCFRRLNCFSRQLFAYHIQIYDESLLRLGMGNRNDSSLRMNTTYTNLFFSLNEHKKWIKIE